MKNFLKWLKNDFFDDQEEYELIIKYVSLIGVFTWPLYGFVLKYVFLFQEDIFLRSIVGFILSLFLLNNYLKFIPYKPTKLLWTVAATWFCTVIPWELYFLNNSNLYWGCSLTFFSFLFGYLTPISYNFIGYFVSSAVIVYLNLSKFELSDFAIFPVTFLSLVVANIVSTVIRTQKRNVESKRNELQIQKEHNAEFIAKVAHEQKNPIHIIQGLCEIIKEDLSKEKISNDDVFENLDLIDHTCKKLSKQVQDLLQLERFELGLCEMNLTKTNINNYAAIMKKELESLAVVKENKIIVRSPANQIDAMIDKDRFVNVIYNLVENALKFTMDSNSPVVLDFEVDGKMLMISVTDQGIGIPESEVKNVFKKFHQLESTKKSSGSGIGLSLVRDIVSAHGGWIDVTSKIGKGTTIKISLPNAVVI